MDTAAVSAVANQLYGLAYDLSEEPFAGSSKRNTDLGEVFARRAVAVLHDFLVLHPELDDQPGGWYAIRYGSRTWEAWQEGEW